MTIPLSLYIHIPWCIQKCPYCDFNSHQIKGQLPEKAYIDQLLADLQADLKYFQEQRPLSSIFIGGGTPSLLSGDGIKRLLDGINALCRLKDNIEITLEANPGTVDERHFNDYYHSGVNRLSIGIQSFNNQQLQRLGRIHQAADSIRAVKAAQDVGFKRINIDLMFGLPQQTTEQALNDIKQAIALNTEHLSYYQLTIEANTAFAHLPPTLPDEACIDLGFDAAAKHLQAAGFYRYEVSAWHRGSPSKHNLNYWQYGDYLGIGAGAHGKITVFSSDNNNVGEIIRTSKPRSPKLYLASLTRQQRRVKEAEKAFEFMLNTLRLTDGFRRQWIAERGLITSQSIAPTLQKLIDKELLIVDSQSITPTLLGQRFINDMVTAFL